MKLDRAGAWLGERVGRVKERKRELSKRILKTTTLFRRKVRDNRLKVEERVSGMKNPGKSGEGGTKGKLRI